MSTRNGRVSSPRLTEDEINDLLMKLQAILPNSNLRGNSRESPSRTLKETCIYIKKLLKEVDDLSENLSRLLPPGEVNDIRRFVQQSESRSHE